MRLPTFYEQNLIPNWGIIFFIALLFFILLLVYDLRDYIVFCPFIYIGMIDFIC